MELLDGSTNRVRTDQFGFPLMWAVRGKSGDVGWAFLGGGKGRKQIFLWF